VPAGVHVDRELGTNPRRLGVRRRRARLAAQRDPAARGGNRFVKKWGELALGVVTSIGGFLEVGSIATSAQGGAEFGYQLAWVLLLGTLSLAMLMEMTGRLAAVSKRTFADLLRERFGYRFFVLPLVAVFVVSLLVLASEIGGVAIALQMATGIDFRWWAIPTALVGWFLLWRGNFTIVEQGTAMLGLVAISFAVGAL